MPLTCIFSEHTYFSTSVPCYKFLPNLQSFYTRKVRGRGHFRTFPLPMQERDPKMTEKNWVETSHGIQQPYGLKLRDLDWTGLDFTWSPKIMVYDLLAQNHLITASFSTSTSWISNDLKTQYKTQSQSMHISVSKYKSNRFSELRICW